MNRTATQPRLFFVDGQMRTIAQLRSAWSQDAAGLARIFSGSESGDYGNGDVAQAYKVGATLFVAVNARCGFASEIPIHCIDEQDRECDDSPAQSLIDNAPRLLWRAMASYLIWGKCYFRKVYNAHGYPSHLEWLNPLDVQEDIDYSTLTVRGYRWMHGAIMVHLKPCEVIADYTFSPDSDIDGVSAVEVAMIRSNIEVNIGKFGAAFFANSARPDGMLTLEGGELGDTEQKQVRQYWQSIFKGAVNAFRTAIMGASGGKWTWTPINPAPVDLAMPELTNQADMKICAILRVNPALVGIGTVSDPLSSKGTYAEVRQQQMEYVAIPDVRQICNVLNEQWLSKDFPDAHCAWRLEPDLSALTSASLGTGERVTAATTAVGRVWSVNEAREYTGREPLKGHIDRNPDWAINVYNAGIITRNEARVAIAYQPVMAGVPDGFIFDVDPRAKGTPAPAFPAGLSYALPPQPQSPAALIEAKTGQPANQPETVTVEPIPPKRSAAISAQLYELSLWRNKVRKHGYDARFVSELLPSDIVSYVRTNLDERWQPSLVFDAAKEAIRAGQPPVALGAKAEEAEDYWRTFDELKADLGAAWGQYQQAVRDSITPEGVADHAFTQHHETLLSTWIGTADQPGVLTRLLIAGQAAGDVMLQRGKGIEPGTTRALSVGVNWNLISKDALDFARTYGFNLIKGLDDTTRADVRGVIQQGLTQGLSRDEIADLLRNTLSDERIASRATMIAQTEAIRAYNEGSFDRWQQAGVTEAEWQTVRDSHVCPRCNSVHGMRAAIDTGWRSAVDGQVLRPPRHPNCRCFTRPVLP